jgi:hypothetical protein
MPDHHASLDAALARNSGPSAEDVEALRALLAALRYGSHTFTTHEMAERIAASDWLAAHTAAAEARGAERERQQAAQIIAEQVKDCRRAGGGIYTADFVAGLAWANALIADQGGA